jgi:hypothetical protein
MTTIGTKNLSKFAQAALDLDANFQEFERLAGQVEREDVQSDTGFERASKILAKLDATGQKIGTGMIALSEALEESRASTERAANIANARAVAVEERQALSEQMIERLRFLGETVRSITESVNSMRQPAEMITAEEREILARQLPEFHVQLGKLVDEVQKLKVDAGAAHMRSLEKSADALRQSLQAARHRLMQMTEKETAPSSMH